MSKKTRGLVRFQVYLSKRQLRELRKEADKLGVSSAEVIRRALDRHIEDV